MTLPSGIKSNWLNYQQQRIDKIFSKENVGLLTPFCCSGCCRATTAMVPSTRFSPMISGLAGVILTATGFFFRLSIVVSNSTTSIHNKISHIHNSIESLPFTSYFSLMNVIFIFTEVKKIPSISMATINESVSWTELFDNTQFPLYFDWHHLIIRIDGIHRCC